jgi:predicted nucleotidyltransferase
VKEDPAAVAARREAEKQAEERLKWVVVCVVGVFGSIAAWNFVRETQEAVRSVRRPKEPWELG